MAEAYELDGDETDHCIELLGLRDERVQELIREIEHLHAAAEHRSVIEQAKGTIMAATGCSDEAAFAVLVAQSQTENRKVREIALEIMALKRR